MELTPVSKDLWELMMLSATTRSIYLHELAFESRPSVGAEAPDLRSLLAYMRPFVREGEAVKMRKNDTASARLKDLVIRKDHAELLFQYTDSNTADPVFAGLKTTDLRPELKRDGEGIAVSCHVIVSLTKDSKGRHLFLREQVPGIPSSLIGELLTYLIRQSTDLTFEDGDRMRNYRIYAHIDGFMRDSLKKSLKEGGYIAEIEAIEKKNPPTAIDKSSYFEKERKITIGVPGRPLIDAAEELIAKVRSDYAPKGYDEFRVKVRKPKGLTKRFDVPPHLEEALEAVITAERTLTSPVILAQCASSMVTPFVKKMVELLTKETKSG